MAIIKPLLVRVLLGLQRLRLYRRLGRRLLSGVTVQEAQESPTGWKLTAAQGGREFGSIFLVHRPADFPPERPWWLFSLVVSHLHLRGCGIGERLFAAAIRSCRAKGGRSLAGLLRASNALSIALHRKYGFVLHEGDPFAVLRSRADRRRARRR